MTVGAGFYGARFQLDAPATLTRAGGLIAAYDSNHLGLFDVAVVQLSGSNAFPQSITLNTPDVVAIAQFDLPLDYTEISVPLNVTVGPGWYALLFGDVFPASLASARLPFVDQPGPAQTYIYGQQSTGQWYQTLNAPSEIFVEGTPIPEPASGAIFLVAAVALCLSCRRPSNGSDWRKT